MKIATTTSRKAYVLNEQLPVLTLPFTIRRDRGREDCGWRWQGIVGTSEDAKQVKSKVPPVLIVPQIDKYMPTADYCLDLEDGEQNCYIERKADDLIDSLCGGHLRFRGEHERMRLLIEGGSECYVICEASLDSYLWECDHGGRRLSSETLLTVLATWPVETGVSWHFAGSKAAAERLALRIFRLWWRRNHA